ncbi:MAG: hypothetical protein HRT81_10890 [Henriciella sp.]|nr:hypothetical protein [Henriciella sp.]
MIRLFVTAATITFAATACSPAPDNAADTPAATDEVSVTEADTETSSETTSVTEPEESDDIQTVGYPDGWELQPFWSGEYPNAFSVTREGVTVMGHEAITFEEYPPIYCGLPHKATYSPWNAARREADKLEFVAMTYPTTFTIMEDTSVEAFVGDGAEQLALSAGDELIYKSYLAEGFFIAEKDGVQYELNESDLPASTEFQQGPEDQEWVLVTCDDADQTRAWILYDEALKAPGVEVYQYTAFGEASDLP